MEDKFINIYPEETKSYAIFLQSKALHVMNVIIAVFAWIVFSIITLLVITNVILEIYGKWFGGFYTSVSGLLVSCCGILIYAIAAIQFGSLKKMSGIEQSAIETNGIYMYSRNPQFLGWWLLLCGLFVMRPNYLSLCSLFLGVVFGFVQILFEEKNLLLKYGAQYREYMENVRKFI